MTRYRYTRAEEALLESLALPFDFHGELSDKQCVALWEAVEDHLTMHGIVNDEENELGALCAGLLTSIARQDDAAGTSK